MLTPYLGGSGSALALRGLVVANACKCVEMFILVSQQAKELKEGRNYR
jgi:hypothetical protein